MKRLRVVQLHIIAGVASLLLPFLLFIWELNYHTHVPLALYLATNAFCLANAVIGLVLVKRRVPAYDIPSIRGFAVSCGVVASFVGMSLMFHESFGPNAYYKPIGTAFSWISLYTVVYAWSDGLGHLRQYLCGHYRSAEEARKSTWFLPHQRTCYRYILLDCVVIKPDPAALKASAAPSHLVTLIPALIIAIFVNTALINSRLLLTGSEGLTCLIERYPDMTRWASYNALLVVMVSSFSTFLGSMVLHKRITVAKAAVLSVVVYFLPLLNVLLLLSRYEDKAEALQGLLGIIFRSCPGPAAAHSSRQQGYVVPRLY